LLSRSQPEKSGLAGFQPAEKMRLSRQKKCGLIAAYLLTSCHGFYTMSQNKRNKLKTPQNKIPRIARYIIPKYKKILCEIALHRYMVQHLYGAQLHHDVNSKYAF